MNNNNERWHNALNGCASGQCRLLLYCLIQLLDREVRLSTIPTRMETDVSSNRKLKQVQQKQCENLQAMSFDSLVKHKTTKKIPHSCLEPVLISKAQHMGTEELDKNHQKKTAPLDVTNFAKENEQQ